MGLLDNALQALKNQYQETKGNVGLLMSDPKQYMSGLNQDAAEYNRLSSLAAKASMNEFRGLPITPEQAAAKEYIDQKQMDLALGFTGSIKPTKSIEYLYHGTTPQAAKAIEKSGFDINKSADGTIWFTSNPNIGEVAASGKGGIVQRSIDTSKMKLGGWEDVDKYSIDELINMGFDGLKLTEDGASTYQIFNIDKLSKPLQKAVEQSPVASPQQAALNIAPQKTGLLDQTDLSYRGFHSAPGPDFGAPLYDLTGGGQMYPADVYSEKAVQYYGSGNRRADIEAFNLANRVRGNPDAEVTMYRAVPKNADISAINAGDWVTLSKDYAKNHGEAALRGDYKILSQKVKAKDLWTNADSIQEFGYQPQGLLD